MDSANNLGNGQNVNTAQLGRPCDIGVPGQCTARYIVCAHRESHILLAIPSRLSDDLIDAAETAMVTLQT